MRKEKEMLDLIINTAKRDERIRAVLMTGSRVNPDGKKDIFQDYDIVYAVKDVAPFYNNAGYIERFGELIMLQTPEIMRNPSGDGHFTYLMQFADGNRIDLSFYTVESVIKSYAPGALNELNIILLDKDGVIPPFKASGEIYHIKPPSENDYFSCCNNFWWVSMYVAKGIWRDELPYAMSMLGEWVRGELHCMINWHIGIKTGFSVSAGKCGKYYKDFLSERHYEAYKATYSDSDYDNMWNALFKACGLFRELAVEAAGHFGYDYLFEEDKRVTAHLKHVKTLKKDAAEIY